MDAQDGEEGLPYPAPAARIHGLHVGVARFGRAWTGGAEENRQIYGAQTGRSL